MKLGRAGVPATPRETANPRFRSAPATAEDLVLPDGYELISFEVELLGSDEGGSGDHGRLEAYVGDVKV